MSDEQLALKILLGMANKGWPEEDAYSYLLDRAHAGGLFLQERHQRNAGRARNWLHRQYEQIWRWVAQRPAHDPLGNSMHLAELQSRIEDRSLFTPGQAGVSERAVMRALVDKGLQHSSVIVRASTRQLAEVADVNQPTVVAVLRRLTTLKWIELHQPATALQGNAYRLLQGPVAGSFISESTLPKGGKDTPDTKLPAQAHPLFGAKGLGAGVAETFAHLPELTLRRIPGGERLVRVDRQSPVEVKGWPPPPEPRPLAPAPSGPGLTPAELAATTGASVETVRRHLRRLAQAGMAFRTADGSWYRYHFHASALAQHLAVPDTVAIKQERHDLDRTLFLDFLCTSRGGAMFQMPLFTVVQDTDVYYVKADGSGQVVGQRPARPGESCQEQA